RWGGAYRTLAQQLGLEDRTVEMAFERARALLDPVLDGTAPDETWWDPESRAWTGAPSCPGPAGSRRGDARPLSGAALCVAPEVAEALAAGRPVVALETSIVAHGLPAPHNLEAALDCEAAVRAAGAVPATVAVVDGWVRVGLEREHLERLALP